ncbi:2-hydroxyacid dehydrogenase [Gluconobacter wancherniae]|uniref:Dihydrofolate reductase n=1 Tax=Gluconobacter wancherniae NBRC 103581 TaxID=656744 RepID=A0A511AXW7_9PROT|nr:2-hydroxyacid dehydrogenase [Gluconobacter wancherniae]MBF0853177.1 2-hydroxyacid dehydrogenase [Gluconobacter wancherniae]GBD56104.1 dihydrofolate reductase [Gluconobacter wancherniae NBRC 103581]GBR63202.1 D-isomer-specific 2-hydroxyacid dehydrogenase [Gluconobacter wancherniae NBRC 103581]GEK92996.1 dihydrofolate reductase [Gluconobacter wancherniae NBRC 103581]
MKPELLLVEPMMPEIENFLDTAYIVHRYDGSVLPANVASRIRGVATGGGTGVPATLMKALTNLEIIAINGVGTDAVDLKEAARRGISVTTTLNVLTDDVADLAMALMLAGMRDLVPGDQFVRNHQWGVGQLPLAHKVTGQKLGIVGMGQVGQAIAKRARGFDMPVSYYSRRDLTLPGIPFVPELRALAAQSDILVISASGGAQSRHLINRDIMEALGPSGLLVNVSRGSVVDEQALVELLTQGKLGKAALDVFESEPAVPEALLTMKNVVLQPHRASATVETRLQMGQLVVDNLKAHFAGTPLLTPVQ